jgi:aspartate-semialdehyde dehydrogenase
MSQKIGIIGATGAVGLEMMQVLHDRNFPVSELHLFASERSAGKTLSTPFGEKTVELFSVAAAKKMDFVLLAVSGSFAKEYAPQIAEEAVVIDNSSAFRYEDKIPLVVPEINADAIQNAKLIANPNCTTAILAVALYPLHHEFGVKRAIVSTYQATSGAGAQAMQELEEQTKNYLAGKKVANEKFTYPIPFNIIPHIDSFEENGYTREEMKVTWETQKIFNEPDFLISCTAVRIPTFRAHAESATIETEKPINPEVAREVLQSAAGVKVVDNPAELQYPMPLTATKQFDVEVGRIRQSLVFGENGLDFFVCGDQLLKGAALNAVQIAEKILG